MKLLSASARETKMIGRKLGRLLGPGSVLALGGELGAGKTTFVKGLATGLGVEAEEDVSSPTFVLIHEYRGRCPIYHMDWYRLSEVKGADRSMIEDCFGPEGVCVVEWPDRDRSALPSDHLCVSILHEGSDRRALVFEPSKGGDTKKWRKVLEGLR